MSVDPHPASVELAYADAAELTERLARGELSSAELVQTLLDRIAALDHDHAGRNGLHALINLAPDAVELARAADERRAQGGPVGPLHGLPVLVKDNIDTAGPMGCTAGSLALAGRPPAADAPLVQRLRDAGALVLGKTNLSEWANIRSSRSTSGWSAVGGLCRNPHALDRSAGGSSSGSGAAVAAGFAPLSVGTETDGSIVCPAAFTGVVGLKPTVGTVPGAGIVPIAHSQDTAGPMARSVRDVALLYAVLSGQPPANGPRTQRAAATAGSGRPLRLGLPRTVSWGTHADADAAVEAVLARLARAGVELVDPVQLPPLPAEEDYPSTLLTELAHDLPGYLRTRPEVPVATMADLVAFNVAHADREMPHFGQELFERAAELEAAAGADPAALLTDPTYLTARAACVRAARTDGIDAALREHALDALVCPAETPAWAIDLVNGDRHEGGCSTYPAIAGYPVLTVPCGTSHGLPLGIAFIGGARSESTLLRLGALVEAEVGPAPQPRFQASARLDGRDQSVVDGQV